MQRKREGRLTDADITRSRQIKARGSELDWVSNKPSEMQVRELLILSVALEAANERNVCISKHSAVDEEHYKRRLCRACGQKCKPGCRGKPGLS